MKYLHRVKIISLSIAYGVFLNSFLLYCESGPTHLSSSNCLSPKVLLGVDPSAGPLTNEPEAKLGEAINALKKFSRVRPEKRRLAIGQLATVNDERAWEILLEAQIYDLTLSYEITEALKSIESDKFDDFLIEKLKRYLHPKDYGEPRCNRPRARRIIELMVERKKAKKYVPVLLQLIPRQRATPYNIICALVEAVMALAGPEYAGHMKEVFGGSWEDEQARQDMLSFDKCSDYPVIKFGLYLKSNIELANSV